MSDVKNIGIKITDSTRTQPNRNKKEPAADPKAFENQLFETVNKLKSLDSEVNAMMESTNPQKADDMDASLLLKSKKEDVIAENFSAARKASPNSTKTVALLYEQSQSKK